MYSCHTNIMHHGVRSKNRSALPQAGQWFVTGHRCYLPSGLLGGNGTAVHCSDKRMGSTRTPQAKQKKQSLFFQRDFVFPFGPADYTLAAHHQVGGEWPLPRLAIGGLGDPDELVGGYSLIARGAFECHVLTKRSALGREPRVG